MPSYAVDYAEIAQAAQRIAGHVHRTPVVTCQTLDTLAERRLWFKCEHLQRVGAFKFRGATNAVLSLPDEVARRGVVTHSSGNHAQALALAARQREIPATIVMPRGAPQVKRAAVAGYGATVVECEPTLAAREATAAALVAESGGTLVHPYNDARVIAGQGTVALEMLEQTPRLDAIVAPIGGGGLISGICRAVQSVQPPIPVIAAEPAGADDAARSLAAGERLEQHDPQTVADGLRTSLGSLTWPIVRDCLADIVTVSDAEIVAAMRLAWQRAKLLIEPSAATALAAVLGSARERFAGMDDVGIVLSGGNVDLDHLPW